MHFAPTECNHIPNYLGTVFDGSKFIVVASVVKDSHLVCHFKDVPN